MKLYMALDTGEVFTEDEIRKEYDLFKHELSYNTFDDYMEEMLSMGRNREGGLVEAKRYVVWFTDALTGASSPIEVVEEEKGYTADDYISDCEENADDDWNAMLRKGTVTLEEVEK